MTDYVQQVLDDLDRKGDYQPRTYKFYREQCQCVLAYMKEELPGKDPSNLSKDDLKRLMQSLRGDFAVSTQRGYITALRYMCRLNGNDVFVGFQIRYPTDTRPNVDWLTYEQAQSLMNMWKTPLEDMIVVLELLHGFRRVEVIRLRLNDIHFDRGYIDVRGKGKLGGKLRSVPMHPDFERAYHRWMVERAELSRGVAHVKENHVLVYRGKDSIKHYEEMKGGAIDNHLKELSDRAGFAFSNHTLRRTFGRELYRSEVSIVVIATILGHNSIQTTMKYLGISMDDMSAAMEKFRLKRDE